MHISINKAGLTLGSVVAGVHLVWVLLVGLGWAQWWVNFVLWAHMIQAPVVVSPLSWTAAITVLALAFLIPYAIGCKLAWFWNKYNKV